MAVLVGLALLVGVAPGVGASEWDTRDATATAGVQNSYPYKSADPSQIDPLGFPYRSGASYAAWYLADSGVRINAEMPGADGPAPVRFATSGWGAYRFGDAAWTASMWRLGFHVRDDSKARQGDLYVDPEGDWVGVVHEVKDGWVTVAGYEVGDDAPADSFGVAKVRVAKGDCACVVDVFNTPIASSQGGVRVTRETVQDEIRTFPSAFATEVSPPAVDATGTMWGRVSTDGEAFVAYGAGAPGVSFPEGGPFDVGDQDPSHSQPYRYVLYNRTFGNELAYLPGYNGVPGVNGVPDGAGNFAMSPNLDKMAWVTHETMLPEDSCPDGSPRAQMVYDGQGTATTLSRLSLLDNRMTPISTGGLHVDGRPRLTGGTSPFPDGFSNGTLGLCAGPDKTVNPYDLYATDLHSGDSFVATPPQLNSDPAAGQESRLTGLGVVSDPGIVGVGAEVRAASGYPHPPPGDDPVTSPNGYLSSPLRGRGQQAMNLVAGGAAGWLHNYTLNTTGVVIGSNAAVREGLDDSSVDIGMSWPSPINGSSTCEMVEFLLWRCTGPMSATLRNKGPVRSVEGTYDVADPAGTWNEVRRNSSTYCSSGCPEWGPEPPMVVAPATGDVRRPEPALGSLASLVGTSVKRLTPNGRWWHNTWWFNGFYDGSGVCLESVQSGERYDCRPMMDGYPLGDGPVGPNDDGEFLAVYRTPAGDAVTVWAPGSSGKLEVRTTAYLPWVTDGGGSWGVCHLDGVSMRTSVGRRTLATFCRGSQRRFAIIEIPDRPASWVSQSLAGGSGATRGQGVVAGGGRWEVGTRVGAEHTGDMNGSRQGLVGVAVKRDTGEAAPSGAAFYEFSSPSRRWRVLGRRWDSLSVDTAAQGYRLERPGSAAVLAGPCDVYSVPNTGGKQPFLADPPADRRGTYCTWRFVEGSPSGHGGGDARFSLQVRRANGGPVVLDVPETAVPLGPSNQLLVDAAGYDKPLSALGRRLERAAKNLAAGLVDDLAEDVAGVEVEYEVQEMLARLDPWVDHQLAELKGVALHWIDQISPWLEEHVFTPLVEMATNFVNRWDVNFDAVKTDVRALFDQPLQTLEDLCADAAAAAADLGDALTSMLGNPYVSGALTAAGFDMNDQQVVEQLVTDFTAQAADICGALGEQARQAIEQVVAQFVDGPLDALQALFVSVKADVSTQIVARANELRTIVNGAVADLRAAVAGFDMTPLKNVQLDYSSCPAMGEAGYNAECRIDAVREWARQVLKGAHDWILDLVYEPDPNYDYHNPTGCGADTRLLKILHCAVEDAHEVWTDGFTAPLAQLDAGIAGAAAGISAITTDDSYDQLFHCVAGLVTTLTGPLTGTSWWEQLWDATVSIIGGWANWFSGAEDDEPGLSPHVVECIQPTPGGWYPDDADWLPLGPWSTDQVSRFFYAALDFTSNVLADRLSRVTVDGGDVNAVGHAVTQLLVNLTKKTITLDGEPIPDNYFEALEEKLSGAANDVSWEHIWGFLTDGVDGFLGAGMSDWGSIQAGMRCAEVSYNGQWWYDHAPDVVKGVFDFAAFLEGCREGGFVQGTLSNLLEDTGQFLGRPLEERFEYLWENPKGIGVRIHGLFDMWEKRLVSLVQSLLPDGLRELAGWIRSAGTDRKGEIETALVHELDLLMDLLQGEAGAANPVEAAVNGAAARVAGQLDRLAWMLEVGAAQPWLREVAQLIRWANARLGDAVSGVAQVVQAVRDWIAGLGLPAGVETAIFGLLDDIMAAVTDAAQWVEDNAIAPVEAQLDALLQMAFGSIADAVRAQKAAVYDLRDSLVAKFRAWLVEWADKVARACGEGHAKLATEPAGVCDVVTEPVDTIFDAGVEWIAGAIDDVAEVIENRVSGAPRTIREYLDELNCELVLYVYDVQAQVEGMCERINAGLPPFEVKKTSESLLNTLTSKGEELQVWILDELAKASRTIRGFDLESEAMWAEMDATVASGMQFALFAVDPAVRAALGEYLRHALTRVARWVEPMTDEQALHALGEDLGLPDLYRVIQNQVAQVVPFVKAQAYHILGNLPNVDGLAFDLRAATSLADVVNSFGTFGDYLLTWVLDTVDDVTGNLLDLNAKVAGAIGDSVLRVAENTLRVVVDGVVNVFRFVVWAHEYTFEKVMTPLIAAGTVPDLWEYPGFGEAQADATYSGDVRLELAFAREPGGTGAGGAVAAYPSTTTPGEWYVVSSATFQTAELSQPEDLTLEELDGNTGVLDATGFCNVYRASGPQISAATVLVDSGDCTWSLNGLAHTFALTGPLPEWTTGEVPLVSGTETVTLGRPSSGARTAATVLSEQIAAAEDAVVVVPGSGAGDASGLVSTTPAGQAGNGASDQVGGVTSDGRYVVFSSSAANLVAGDANGACDVFLRDRSTGATTALSTTPSGATASGCSYLPALSADGKVVAFSSWAPDLVAGDGNPERDIFVRDLATGAIERVSIPAAGGNANAWNFEPALSGDGRYVAFVSPATNHVAGDTNGAADVFVVDRVADTIERVSEQPGGGEFPWGIAWGSPVPPLPWGTSIGISDDGNRVVFMAGGAIYVRDRGAGTTERVDRNDQGDPSDGTSARPAISGDGRYVAFASSAGNLAGAGEAPDANGQVDVFRRDLQSGTIRTASRSAGGVQSNGASGNSTPAAVLSSDGRTVVFDSAATNLTALGGNGQPQIYARDMDTGAVTLVSATPQGGAGNGQSSGARLGANGTVAYVSAATDLVAGDTNAATDVFVSGPPPPSSPVLDLLGWVMGAAEGYFTDLEDRAANVSAERWVEDNLGFRGRFSPEAASTKPDGGFAEWGLDQVGGVSPDGRYVVFAGWAHEIVAGDENYSKDVFLRDRFTETSVALSTTPSGALGTGGGSWFPAMSRDGKVVAFVSAARDLVAGDTNGLTEVFVRDLDSGAMERVVRAPGGGEANNHSSSPVLSGDGRYVGFVSRASNLVAGDTNAALDAFVLDRVTGAVERVSLGAGGGELPGGISENLPVPYFVYGPAIGMSDDGDRVVFVYQGGVYVRDRASGTTRRVDVADDGAPANATSARATISGDGRYVVFASAGNNLAGAAEAPDTNWRVDVFRHDLERGRTRTVSRPAGGGQSNGDSGNAPVPGVSRDGRWVVFDSTASNLTGSSGDGLPQMYARDMRTERVKLLSADVSGTPRGRNVLAAVGGDGTVGFVSSGQLDSGDGNSSYDVYVSDVLVPFETWLETRLSWWLEGKDDYLVELEARRAREESRQELIGELADAAFEALSGFVGEGSDTGAGGGPVLVNVTPWGAVEDGGNGELHDRPRVSGDGRFVVFTSDAADLVVGDANDTDDVFRRDTVSGVTVRVSENVATGGEAPEDMESRFPAVSGDGRYVAYRTQAANLTAPGAAAVVSSGVLVWDAVTGVNTLVPGSEGATGDVAISGDGRWVVYGREGSDDEEALWVYRYDRVADTTAVVNVPVSGDTPDGDSSSLGVSDDGRHVLFVTYASNLHFGDDPYYATDALVRDMDAGVTSSAGQEVGYEAALSGNGRFVVFDSWAALVAEDTNGVSDVYRSEVGVGTPVLTSVASDGAQGLKGSSRPSVSSDGSTVVFLSDATNLAAGTGSDGGVLVRDVTAGVTRFVNAGADGRALPGWLNDMESPAVSGDGTRAVFPWSDEEGAYVMYSATTNPPPPPSGELSVQDARDTLSAFVAAWVGGRSAEEQAAIASDAQGLLGRLLASLAPMFGDYGVLSDPVLVSASGAGDPGNQSASEVQVSPDGAASVFTSRASNLAAGDTNNRDDVFVSGTAAPAAERVSVATDGTESNGSSATGSASDGASRVAFASDATNLVADDTNAKRDVFLRDRGAATTVRVSVATDGTQANGSSYDPEISADGRYVTFSSDAANLVAGDTNGARDVFVRDLDTAVTERVSVDGAGVQGNGISGWTARNHAVISGDGKCVAFTSAATNLVAGDTNGARDVFIRDRVAGTTTRWSVATDGTQANGGVPTSTSGGSVLSISGDCWYVVFLSDAGNLVAGDTNAKTDAFSREMWDGGVTDRMSVGVGGTQTDQSVTAVSVDYDWYYVGFVTSSDMGDATDTNGLADAYVKDPWDSASTHRVGIGRGGREPNATTTSVSLAYETAMIASAATNLVETPHAGYNRTEAFYVTTLPKDVEVPYDMAAFLSGALDVIESWATDARAQTQPDVGVARDLAAAVRGLLRRYASADGVDWARRQAVGEQVVRDFLGELADIWGADPGDPAQAVLDALERVQGWLGESPAGLEAAYYAGSSPLGTPVAEGVDAGVDFAWGAGGPAGLTDDFSVSWRGRVVAPVTGAVEFTVESDDGARLWVDGRRVLDDWSAPGAGSASATVDLVAGLPVPLRLEYRETSGSAAVSLRWRLPGAATGVVVPASALLAGEPRVGDLPRTITGLERFGDTAAVVMGRANTDVARGVGAPADSLTALLVATAPYDDPQGSLAYGYRDGSDQVTVATTGLDTVTATGSGITVTGTCTRLRVPLVMGPLAPPVKEGPLPCTWRVYDDAGTTRLDVSGAGVTGAAVLTDWRLTVKYPT